ncbi:hypothetical protein B0T25DRAFT_109841 [Lasiosphaeria hispida]|uniref:Uncharacterized protein n=1 Tax=Lasiosphaeria hispida TaxID=260671 RepID=A0AAJ0HR88_9PEZI|nr:hypothetical protein B0T25DRAFT_109841 [Lasiosphaeria hispida]
MSNTTPDVTTTFMSGGEALNEQRRLGQSCDDCDASPGPHWALRRDRPAAQIRTPFPRSQWQQHLDHLTHNTQMIILRKQIRVSIRQRRGTRYQARAYLTCSGPTVGTPTIAQCPSTIDPSSIACWDSRPPRHRQPLRDRDPHRKEGRKFVGCAMIPPLIPPSPVRWPFSPIYWTRAKHSDPCPAQTPRSRVDRVQASHSSVGRLSVAPTRSRCALCALRV